jgi:sarcosine oxidase subunit beta
VTALPERASVVVVGGGVIGASIAFHLAEAGVRDVVLLEKGELGGGSTSKAAGGVRAQFSDEVNIRLGQRSLAAFADFERRPGQAIDLHRVGYLFCLSRPEDVAVFERSVALQNRLGVPSRLITPAEARQLSPLIETSDLLAAAYSPDDGHCAPESVVLGYASAARRLGATVLTGHEVTGIDVRGSEVVGVRTPRGLVATDTVVCAAGAWSGRVAAMAGVDLPVQPYRREIAVTGPVAGLPGWVDQPMPMTIDFASSFYFHREGPGLLMGISDPDEAPGFDLSRSARFLELLAAAASVRAPRVLDAGVRTGWAGLYEVTPDHNALVGSAASVSRLLYATGFSGHGFLQAPAVGEVVRDLYLGEPPVVDVTALSVERFARAEERPEHNVV